MLAYLQETFLKQYNMYIVSDFKVAFHKNAACTARLILTVLLVTCSLQCGECVQQHDAAEVVNTTVDNAIMPEMLFSQLTENDTFVEHLRVNISGKTFVRYQQYYNGTHVDEGDVTFELGAEGTLIPSSVIGNIVTSLSDDLPARDILINESTAEDVAKQNSSDPKLNITSVSSNLFIQIDNDEARYVYETKLSGTKSEDNEIVAAVMRVVLIDGITAEVIDTWNNLQDLHISGVGGNEKKGQHFYGWNGYGLLDVTYIWGRCFQLNSRVGVAHCHESWWCPWIVHDFDCFVGNRDTVNGGYSALNDALYYGTVTDTMFTEWYGFHSLRSVPIRMKVHFGCGFDNAFWDGSSVTFGDGFCLFYPLVDINIVAHEIGHGFTQQNSGLIYRGESGGMNEAFSDIMGEAAEYYLWQKVDWKMGWEIHKGDALRYFDIPPRDGVSLRHYSEYRPGIDVHYSSGIYNKAFYNLATTPGWNVKKAFDCFVYANCLFWRRNTKMNQGVCGVENAARLLGYKVSDVTDAFRCVGLCCSCILPLPPCCRCPYTVVPPPICPKWKPRSTTTPPPTTEPTTITTEPTTITTEPTPCPPTQPPESCPTCPVIPSCPPLPICPTVSTSPSPTSPTPHFDSDIFPSSTATSTSVSTSSVTTTPSTSSTTYIYSTTASSITTSTSTSFP